MDLGTSAYLGSTFALPFIVEKVEMVPQELPSTFLETCRNLP